MSTLHKVDSKMVKVVALIKDEAAMKEYGDTGQHGVNKVTTKGSENVSSATAHLQESSLKIVAGHNLNEDSQTKTRFGRDKNTLLLFVDGKEMHSNTLDTMNPTTIKSFNVLKDESATNL